MDVEDKNKKIEFDKIYDEKNEIMYFFLVGEKNVCTLNLLVQIWR